VQSPSGYCTEAIFDREGGSFRQIATDWISVDAEVAFHKYALLIFWFFVPFIFFRICFEEAPLTFSSAKRTCALFLCGLTFWFGACDRAAAWSLKTHVWIAQQVLNDAADGQLTIAGGTYAIPPPVLNALRLHPDRYRMGSLGPDVFPDPVVGQMTTHPGVGGGWQTDDWLKHLLTTATTGDRVRLRVCGARIGRHFCP
jgi:hypothetical protein